jgi:hypothetical protein
MSKVSKVNETVPYDLDKYINQETGETLESEVSSDQQRVTVTKDSGMRRIDYEDYAVIDKDAVDFLSEILNRSDLACVLQMAIITKTPLNIVFNGNVPHTNESLQKYLRLNSEAMYMKLIKRLINIGILYQIKGRIYGEVRVCYMLNPFLSKKRYLFEEKVFHVFEKFDKQLKAEDKSIQ